MSADNDNIFVTEKRAVSMFGRMFSMETTLFTTVHA